MTFDWHMIFTRLLPKNRCFSTQPKLMGTKIQVKRSGKSPNWFSRFSQNVYILRLAILIRTSKNVNII